MRLRRTDGFTLIELIIVVLIIGIIAAIAVPGLLRARWTADESAAIGSLRAIHGGQLAFSASCGSGHFAPSLDELGKPPTASGGPGFITSDLGSAATVTKNRYTFRMGGTRNTNAPAACTGLTAGLATSGYQATASAVSPGDRHFGLNTAGGMWEDDTPFVGFPEQGAPAAGKPVGR